MSLICEICESVYENEKIVNCKICGAILNKKISENEKLRDNTAEYECFDDFEEFNDIEEIEDIEDFLDIEDKELLTVTDSLEESTNDSKFTLSQLLKDEKRRTNYHEEDYFKYKSYPTAIEKLKIYPNKITYTIFDYHIVNPKYLLARVVMMLKRCMQNGILILEDEVEKEPNPFLRLAIGYLAIGTEYNILYPFLKLKKEWSKKVFLQYSNSVEKKEYMQRVMIDFDFITEAVMLMYAGEGVVDLYTKAQRYHKTFYIKFDSKEDLESSEEAYFKAHEPYLLLNEDDYKSRDIVDVFNEKRDPLQPLELYVVEDIVALSKRFLRYSKIARTNGVVHCFNASLQDPNMLIRHLFQKIILEQADQTVVEKYVQEYKNKYLSLASKYHNDEFIFLYEREIDLIAHLTDYMLTGDSLESQIISVCNFFPELQFDESFLDLV